VAPGLGLAPRKVNACGLVSSCDERRKPVGTGGTNRAVLPVHSVLLRRAGSQRELKWHDGHKQLIETPVEFVNVRKDRD